MTIEPTWTSPLAEQYARPGGPWDGPTLDSALSERPVSVVDGATRVTAPELEALVARTAGGLSAAGVGPGDGVSWQAPNSLPAVVLYRACWRIGAVAVPVHHQAGVADAARMLDGLDVMHVDALDLPSGPPVVPASSGARSDLAAAVLFTSGSSGAPKGAIHTQRALRYKAELMARVHGLSAADVVLMPAPLAHISGLLNGVLLPGTVPLKTVLMAKWHPDAALDLIEREGVTFMIGPPTFFVGLMGASSFSPERVASLRLISSGGAGVTPAFVANASTTLGCAVKRTYGSTEAPTITTSQPNDPPAAARDTDGRATGAAELRIAPGNGELEVRAPELFAGYTDPSRNTEAFTDDGWFKTGDRATIDGGWLTITGRLKDVIIRGGENISIAEVESVLEAHPSVAHAVAVGAPDERLGEVVVAFVVVAPGASFDESACQAWFVDQRVARFKTPSRVVAVDEVPTLAAGKPDRAALLRLLR